MILYPEEHHEDLRLIVRVEVRDSDSLTTRQAGQKFLIWDSGCVAPPSKDCVLDSSHAPCGLLDHAVGWLTQVETSRETECSH